MGLTSLQMQWFEAAKRRGLNVDVPYTLRLPNGDFHAEVRLRGYGAKNGMLIVSDPDRLTRWADELVKMGYGYSCMSKIDSDEDLTRILKDWGEV